MDMRIAPKYYLLDAVLKSSNSAPVGVNRKKCMDVVESLVLVCVAQLVVLLLVVARYVAVSRCVGADVAS